MRDYKLRAWDKTICTMREVTSIDFQNKTVYCKPSFDLEYPIFESLRFHFAEIELLRPTGSFDSDGIAIYEGDIIENDLGLRWEIIYVSEKCSFVKKGLNLPSDMITTTPIDQSHILSESVYIVGHKFL